MYFFLSACGGSSNNSDATFTTNNAPVANAGVDQSVNTGSFVNLDASSSSDENNDALTYEWAAITIPSGSIAVLSATSVVNPSFTADLVGEYTFQVAVNDGTETITDQITVTASLETPNGTSSTDGIVFDYSYSEFNSSSSANTTSSSAWACTDTTRELVANGIPDHDVTAFPNQANAFNEISEQTISASLTLTPNETDTATTLGGPAGVTGYVLNGVKIDAGTAGSCDDSANCSLIDNSGGWSIEALGQTSFDFGTDDNNAHVQPGGAYHYHGMPEGFIDLQGGDNTKMTLIGWAADGFPVYARYGYREATNASSAIKNITGSYQLVSTVSDNRPSTDTYELGTFSQDWEYQENSGDLDQCNGRFGVTPEFPNGIYHYFATNSYPYFLRCVKGEVEGAGGPPTN
ncbi:MAG: hypothetical protein ACI88H_000391 [Cocleimonas sp.]